MDDLGQRHPVGDHHAVARLVLHVEELAPPLLAELHHVADIRAGHHDGGGHHRLADALDLGGIREMVRVVNRDLFAITQLDTVFHGGRGAEQGEVELALQALLDDLHVEQTEKPAAKAESKRGRRLRLINQRGVVELEFLERFFQLLVLFGVGRKKTRENHRRDVAVPGQRRRRWTCGIGDGVAHPRVADVANIGDQVADLAGGKILDHGPLRAENPDLVNFEALAGLHHQNSDALAQGALEDTDVGDDTAVGIELRVEDQRP